MIFLDTHVVVWLYGDEKKRLSKAAREAIEENDLRISPLVLTELDFLHEIKRIKVGAQEIFSFLQRRIGLEIEDKSFFSICLATLCESWTRDPFDRFILSHAREDKLPLVSKDALMRKNYDRTIW